MTEPTADNAGAEPSAPAIVNVKLDDGTTVRVRADELDAFRAAHGLTAPAPPAKHKAAKAAKADDDADTPNKKRTTK